MVDVGLVNLQIAGFGTHFPYHFLISSAHYLKCPKFNYNFSKKGKLIDVESTLIIPNSSKDHHDRRFSCKISQSNQEVATLAVEKSVNVRWAPENTDIIGAEEFLELNAAEITCQSKC